MIELTNVTKTFGPKGRRFEALKRINLTIPDGASVAIVGKSGSGKSTLMHAMSGLDRPQQGRVVVDGKDILTLRPKDVDQFRSRHIGFIFQSFFVQANESCFDNVSLPLEISGYSRSQRRTMVLEALERVQMSDKVTEMAGNLSGGQKQRLAIARAIVTKPDVLFADEPTGNLDSATGATIEDLLFQLNREEHMTLIIVTHDAELAARCAIRVHIKDGEIDRVEGDGHENN